MAEQQQANLTACEYKTGKTLGQGSYATVKEAVKIKTGEKFAVKMISKKLMKGREHMILNEIEVLKKISQGHPNILNLWDYFETPNNLYLVVDLCTGGELFDRICEVGQFYEKDAAKIIHTVLGAVKYLHGLNVVHRDLKPENLLFKDRSPNSDLLIADFGLSKYIVDLSADDTLKTTCGTPGYMAPEVLQKLGHAKPVDMWSIGVMALCGYMPFETPTEVVDLNLVLRGMYSFDEMYWADVSQTAKDFIIALLLVDPKRRMTVEKALAHPWMTESFPIPTKDLFPNVRKGFNARKTFKKAIDVVKAVNKLSSSSMSLRARSFRSEKSDDGEKGKQPILTVSAGDTLSVSAAELERRTTGASQVDDSSSHLQSTLLIVPGSNDPLQRAITNSFLECLYKHLGIKSESLFPILAHLKRKQLQLMADIQLKPEDTNAGKPSIKAPAKDAGALAPCEYKTGKTLGQGSYGVVKEGVKISTGERFAVKMISKKLMRGKEALILNEINILKKVSKGNKNIVTLHDYFESPNNLYLVMDLCTGGELFDRIINKGYFYEEDAAKIIRTVCSAIQYLHQNSIVHRDLKPENLIFRSQEEDSDLLIADFGLSRITADPSDHGLKTYAGTPGYMAPEIIQKTGHGKPVDMWAIGVMSYFLLAGTLPFESASNVEEVDNVINARYSYDDENWKDISDDAKKFIDSVVIVDPSKRLTAEDALKHDWLNPQRVSTISNKDLLPVVRSGFDARKMFKKAFDVVRAVNKLSHTNLNAGSRNPSQVNITLDGLRAEDPSRDVSSSNLFLGTGINSRNPSMKAAPVSLGMPFAHSAAASQDSIYKAGSQNDIHKIDPSQKENS